MAPWSNCVRDASAVRAKNQIVDRVADFIATGQFFRGLAGRVPGERWTRHEGIRFFRREKGASTQLRRETAHRLHQLALVTNLFPT
jgi:hypothetical protein